MLVTDFDPLRIQREWKGKVMAGLDIPAYEVDAHNIVPCWLAASRRIMSFHTFKARISPMLEEWLVEYPQVPKLDRAWTDAGPASDWNGALDRVGADASVPPIEWLRSGETAPTVPRPLASAFHPTGPRPGPRRAPSRLSPIAQTASSKAALEVLRSDAPDTSKEAIPTDWWCSGSWRTTLFHAPGAICRSLPKWARKGIDEHGTMTRAPYTREQLEGAQTHDTLWNATQTELVKIGKIRGALREYWALKILEWTPSPEEALDTALHLNDKYGMDGRDPSGYTGIAMVIGGLYGKPWNPKEVIGKLRKLTYTREAV
jgi:deoxyribodipyrimidine photo-lyase